jgi:hypothetical protein
VAPQLPEKTDDAEWMKTWQGGLVRAELIHAEIARREAKQVSNAKGGFALSPKPPHEFNVANLSGLRVINEG